MLTKPTFKFRPTRIDYYILSEIGGPFVGGLIFFMFVFMMFQVLRLADIFIVHGGSAALLGKLMALMAVSFLPTAFPVAFLIAVLMAFGRLSADSELIAMKANGISAYRLAIPISGVATLLVGVCMLVNVNLVPWGERAFKSTLIKISNTHVVSAIKEGTFTTGFYNLLVFADKVDPKTNRLTRVFIYDEREPKNPATLIARTGEIIPIKTASELSSAVMLKLYEGSIHQNALEEDVYRKINFSAYQTFLSLDESSGSAAMKPHMYSQADLINRMKTLDPKSYEGRETKTEYWRRYTMALTPLIFAFLGIGFGTLRTRSVRAGAGLTALLVLLLYWYVQTQSILLTQNSAIDPFWAMQFPNLAILIPAVFGFRRAIW